MYDKVSIYGALLAWPISENQYLRSTSAQVGNTWSSKGSIARPDSQDRNFAPILNVTEAIKCSFLCVKPNGVCPSKAQRYSTNDTDTSLESLIVTRIESFCEKRRSSRVTIFLNMTRVEIESPKILTRVIDIESRYHCNPMSQIFDSRFYWN